MQVRGCETAIERTSGALPRKASGRIVQLDILRAIAILLVIAQHTPLRPRDAGRLQVFATVLQYRVGWTGVDLFFVLSGFLIGGLLMGEMKKRGKLDVRRFLIRRGLKIWPLYLIYVAYFSLFILITTHGATWKSVVTSDMVCLLQIQNYLPVDRGFLWSVAVEEHFYLLLPLVFLWITRRGIKGIHQTPAIAFGLMVICLGLRIATWQLNPHYRFYTFHAPSHLRMDSLMCGVWLAYLYHFRPDTIAWIRRHRPQLFAAGGILVAVATAMFGSSKPQYGVTIGFTMIMLGYGSIMMAFLFTPLDGLCRRPARLLASVGAFSYTIYLWHTDLGIRPAAWILARLPQSILPNAMHWTAGLVLSIVFAVTAGAAIATVCERPILALRDRLFPGNSAPL